MAEKELNLLELPALYMAQLGASTAQVTGSKVLQTDAQSTLPDNGTKPRFLIFHGPRLFHAC